MNLNQKQKLNDRVRKERQAGNLFYVYLLCFPDTRKPYYVGKGTNGRIFGHLKDAKRGNKSLLSIYVRKFGASIVFDSFYVDEGDAFGREIELIKFYGRRDLGLGSLVNRVDGGRWSLPSTEDWKRLWSDPEFRLKFSQMLKERWSDPEYKKRVGKAISEGWTEDSKRRKRQSLQKYYDDPEWQAWFSGIQKIAHATPEYRRKLSEVIKESWTDERKKEASEILVRLYNENPERKIQVSKSTEKSWKDPKVRKKRCEGVKKALNTEEWKRGQSIRGVSSWADPEVRSRRMIPLLKALNSPSYKKIQSDGAKDLWKERKSIISRCKEIIQDNSLHISLPKIHSSLNILRNFEQKLFRLIKVVPYGSDAICKAL